MTLKTDKQTLNDLGIIGRQGDNTVYGIFNRTITNGGAKILEDMFLYPLSDIEEIRKRSRAIAFFSETEKPFPFKGEIFDVIEHYLSNNDNRSRISIHEYTLEQRIKSALGVNTQFIEIKKGVIATLQFLIKFNEFVVSLISKGFEKESGYSFAKVESIIQEKGFCEIFNVNNIKKLSDKEVIKLDHIFRFSNNENIIVLKNEAYLLDVLITVSNVGREKGFSYAHPLKRGANRLEISKGFHPLLKNAIPNTLSVSKENNLIFLTGANMAGKSTFMKMVGIAIYLAHMGFPVPAAKMEFAVLDGLYSTINLADNINMGYSHFYAEVLRVKKVAEAVGNHNMLVIFDELFRGTNVKDAYNATVAVTDAFANKLGCVFIISTHIVEAGEELKEMRDNIKFIYLPTVMSGSKPEYTYKITEGITNDRHGMLIIQNEKILDILKKD